MMAANQANIEKKPAYRYHAHHLALSFRHVANVKKQKSCKTPLTGDYALRQCWIGRIGIAVIFCD
jgi:hypothetical protein